MLNRVNKFRMTNCAFSAILLCVMILFTPLDAYALVRSCGISGSGLVVTILNCFESQLSGAFTTYATSISTSLGTVVASLCVLAIMFYAIKLTFGGFTSLTGDTMMLLIKIMLVGVFAINANILIEYRDVLVAATKLLGDLFASAIFAGDICTNTNSLNGVFGGFDCVINNILGVPIAGDNLLNSFGIAVFLIGLLFSGFGVPILLLVVGLLITIIEAVMLIIVVYFKAMFAVTILMALAPVIMPMLLFNPTKKMVDTWWKEIINYSLQPIVMSAYLGLIVAVMMFYAGRISSIYADIDLDIFNNQNKNSSMMAATPVYDAHSEDYKEIQAGASDVVKNSTYLPETGQLDQSSLTGWFTGKYDQMILMRDKAVNFVKKIHGTVQEVYHAYDKNGLLGAVLLTADKLSGGALARMQAILQLPSLKIAVADILKMMLWIFMSIITLVMTSAFLRRLPHIIGQLSGSGNPVGLIPGRSGAGTAPSKTENAASSAIKSMSAKVRRR